MNPFIIPLVLGATAVVFTLTYTVINLLKVIKEDGTLYAPTS